MPDLYTDNQVDLYAIQEALGVAPVIPVLGYTSADMQDAVDAALSLPKGGVVVLPPGQHTWATPIVVDLSSNVSASSGSRIVIRGAGSAVCYITFTADSETALTITGASPSTWVTGGAQTQLRLEGFRLSGGTPAPASARGGIELNMVIDATFNDVQITECYQALLMVDTVITRFFSCNVTYNNYGIRGEPGPLYGTNVGSPPNEILFSGCHFLNNRQYGLWFELSTNIVFTGGSFENNGITASLAGLPGAWTSDTDRWGIRITNGGYNGAGILTMVGTHFEGQCGKAGVWMEHNDWPGIYNIDIDFVQNGTLYCDAPILFDTTGDTKAVVNVRSGFHSVNGYTPSSSRRYIQQGTVTGTLHRINYESSMFESDTECPSFGDQTHIPATNSLDRIGSITKKYVGVHSLVYWFSNDTLITSGSGSPEGASTANLGSVYIRADGSGGSRIYFKTGSGFNSTGWTAIL